MKNVVKSLICHQYEA